jgi:uncharacterized protein
MSIPTLYLDCLILASAIYPSGFSLSLFTLRQRRPGEISTAFLAVLVFTYLAVVSMVWIVRPEMLAFRSAAAPLFGLAVLVAPVALLVEYGIHALAAYRISGHFSRRITVQRFWHRRLSAIDHILLGLVVIGEEIFYRVIWLGAFQYSFGLPMLVALGVSSVVYGLNHLAFGGTAVISKTVSGLLYGSLYLLGGHSVLLPIVSHGLQNLILFKLAGEDHA